MNESLTSSKELAVLAIDRVVEDSLADEHVAEYYASLHDPKRALFAREHNFARWSTAYEFCLSAQVPSRRAAVLDIGCGVGTHALALASAGMVVVGVDLSARAVESAVRRAAAWRAAGFLDEVPSFHLGSGVDEAFGAKGQYDIVLLHESLAHVGERSAIWPAIRGALRPGGTVVIAESNAMNPAVAVSNWLREREGQPAISDSRYIHKTLRSARALSSELRDAGISVSAVRFFGFAPSLVWARSKGAARGIDATLARTPILRHFAVSYTLTGRIE